ncbi:MAG: cbb3-type cytochrome c oxidase subunit 3 [Planctomycetota bacterium]
MFKHILSEANLTAFATWGLVIFVAVFLGVTIWTLTRPKRTVDKWSSIPLKEGTEPVEERA